MGSLLRQEEMHVFCALLKLNSSQGVRFTVHFVKGTRLRAMLAPSNNGVRRGLMDAGVSFSMPLELDETWKS